ncbi:MAG TPA: hypothetical protein VGA07_07865 [Anaerolineales bacterium]
MGRTLPSITQAFLHEQQSLARFRRALRREDQRALDDLLAEARQHLAASAYASHLLPFEVMLLAMLVEEHKRVLHLEGELELLRREARMSPDSEPERRLSVED